MNPPSLPSAETGQSPVPVRRPPYEPAVGPRLKVFLFLIFAAFAVLGTTGIYLVSIRVLNNVGKHTYTNPFTLWMFLIHILLGLVMLAPFLFFGIAHYLGARRRPNRLAVRLGLAVFIVGLLIAATGVALIQLEGLPQVPAGSIARWVVYGLHVGTPVLAVFLYVQHRRAGPRIQWRWGYAWGGAVIAFVGISAVLHLQDPRQWGRVGPREGEKYFEPSKARTANGDFIPARSLMMDEYCRDCHADIYEDHFHSAHRFASFNNPAYLFSVRNSRKIVDEDGVPRAARWCAGCHDPVPFFSGAFDNPHFDDVNDPTAHAGITCSVCHAMTHVNSVVGNGAYTIEEPQHYPFAYSSNGVLQWLNKQLVKAKPDFHKRTFLKPLHQSPEFCSTCHKVSLPVQLNFYREYLPGQNHYDNFLLSGVHGGNARAFYYPPRGHPNCNSCHMPLKPSQDFGSKDFDGTGVRKVHNHLFLGANTGLPALLRREPRYARHAKGFRAAQQTHAKFLRDNKLRIDIFGVVPGETPNSDALLAPLRPSLPALEPGKTYVIEVVLRTLGVGHFFTQGTVDSNEVWVEMVARSGEQILGHNGALRDGDAGPVDPWAHRINALLLDREGNRIDRRNPEDIFVKLYDHQIPPGAAQVVHYRLKIPEGLKAPVELEARVRYRKFDHQYMRHVYGKKVPVLPIVDLCSDRVVLPVQGGSGVDSQTSPIEPAWQRWNDYGIGCFLEEDLTQKKKKGLRRAEYAFQTLRQLDIPEAKAHAHLNLVRVYWAEGTQDRLAQAIQALEAAQKAKPPAPWWTVSWFNGLITLQNANSKKDVDLAIEHFERIVDPDKQPTDRGFDFSQDYVVLNKLGEALFIRAQKEDQPGQRGQFLQRAIRIYMQADQLNPENAVTHYGLYQCYQYLASSAPEVPVPLKKVDTDEANLMRLLHQLANTKRSTEERQRAAGLLGQGLYLLARQRVQARDPKRPRLERLRRRLYPLYQAEREPTVKRRMADLLSQVHLQLSLIFKGDESAQDARRSVYRRKHPAADLAARAPAIYPLHREGEGDR